MLAISELHNPQGLVVSNAFRAATGDAVQVPAIQRVASQLNHFVVELGHSEVTQVQ